MQIEISFPLMGFYLSGGLEFGGPERELSPSGEKGEESVRQAGANGISGREGVGSRPQATSGL
jgi:hypothetical protein